MAKITRPIELNPPISRVALGAYSMDHEEASKYPSSGRNEILGPDRTATRNKTKGVMYQDDWGAETDAIYNVKQGSGDTTSTRDKNRYGFRFTYNPSTISYSVVTNPQGLDPGLFLSGQTEAHIIPDQNNVAVVSFSLIINRIEDISFLQRKNPDMKYFYGRDLTPEERDKIISRGTGYDLEYLFRTILGKPWDTKLRGYTADIGMGFGLPIILDLSPRSLEATQTAQKDPLNYIPTVNDTGDSASVHGQRYLGRISGIDYIHREFNQKMVPMFTEVIIQFARYPDTASNQSTTATTQDPLVGVQTVTPEQVAAATGGDTRTIYVLEADAQPNDSIISEPMYYDPKTDQFLSQLQFYDRFLPGSYVPQSATHAVWDKWNNAAKQRSIP